jgi:RNA polymerase sigma-70 factor (ECF subfamily)
MDHPTNLDIRGPEADERDVLTFLGTESVDQKNAAFERLIGRYRKFLESVIQSKVRNPHDAQNVRQDVELHIFRKLPQLREPRAFGGWAERIAQRWSLNFVTRLKSRGHFGGDADKHIEDHEMDDSALQSQREENAEFVHWGLGQLKPTDREALDAFYLQGRSLKEMAGDFDAPVGTIKRRLHIARHRLREVLEQVEAA